MVIRIENPDLLKIVSQTLLNDGVAILPSDTLYGFSCIQGKGEHMIEEIKGRGAGKHFLKLALKEQLPMLTPQLPDSKLLSYWPGPLTLILKGIKNPTEGIRVPDNQFIKDILKKVGQPIISTSVNYSGQSPMTSIEEIIDEFENKVDLIVDAGVLPPSLPSTIIDISTGIPRLVRQGQLKVNL
ncbi:MAG: L-threonylcarbamoyladenylate synthase [Spirochaetia bacterium]|nr:L-threonylcarbamoyladenylate synthase [Spirochaetia bacterium]